MATADTARLIASLELQDKFTATARKIEGSLGRLESKSSITSRAIGTALGVGLARAADVGISALVKSVFGGIDAVEKLETLGAQTEAVIKSTGGAAGITAVQVRTLAEKFEGLNATIDDKVIQNTENLLLTFTDIRKEAFEPALKAILDMNTAMGGGEEGLQSVAIQVGKALQDPIKGITALRRVGVNFSEDQQEVIRSLVETGDTLGAQKLVLAELNKEFGGSFLAQGNTTSGKVAKLRDAFEDLQITLAKNLLPSVSKIADRLTAFLNDPKVVRGVQDLGASIAGHFTTENLDALAGTARTIGDIVGTAVGLFQSLPPELQKVAIGALAVNKLTGGAVTNVVGSLLSLGLSQLKTITAAQVTVVGGTVTGPGAIPGATGGGGTSILPAIGVAGIILAVTQIIGPPLRQFFIDNGLAGSGSNAGKSESQLARERADAQMALEKQQRANDLLAALGTKTDRTYDKLEQNRLAILNQKPTPVTVNLSTTVKTNVFGTTATTTTTYNRFLPGGIVVV